MSKYLVYITGLRGPEAQIWADGFVVQNGKPVPTLFKHELTPLEANLELDELKRRYPYAEPTKLGDKNN